MKNKSKAETEAAMRSIIEENNGKSCYKLWTDEGKEWLSLQDFYDEFEIERYSTKSPLKSVMIERFNSTLEQLLYKAMTAKNTRKWIDLLPTVMKTYNNRVSSVLHGLTPNEAHLKKNEGYLRKKFFEENEKHKEKFKNKPSQFSPGDKVRIVKKRGVFSRGYEPISENEIRTVEEILPTYPKTIRVSGKQRSFYEPELIKVTEAANPKEKDYFSGSL